VLWHGTHARLTVHRATAGALLHTPRRPCLHGAGGVCPPRRGRRPRQPAQASTAVGHDGREGLVDFVGDRGGQFAQGGHARDVRQLRLRLAQGFLGPLAFGDVLDHADREHQCAALVSHNVYGHVAPDESAVLADIAFLYVVVVASATQHIGKGCPVGLYIVGVREGREGHALELLGTAMTARA
jgi:hypothetical protein